jgi:hypothetical protein
MSSTGIEPEIGVDNLASSGIMDRRIGFGDRR